MKEIITPSLEQLDALVGYRLRRDIPVREKPYTCACCKEKHRIVGSENNLFRLGAPERNVIFCAVCVASGRAYNEVIFPFIHAKNG